VDIVVATPASPTSRAVDTDARQFRKVLDVNLGAILTLRAAARVMRRAGPAGTS